MSTVALHHGDCLEKMKDIPDGSVDMVLTDPPYGTTACKWDSVIPFDAMWEQLKRITKQRGAIALCGSEPFSSVLRMSNTDMYKYDWIWNKKKGSNYPTAKKMPLKIHEIVSIFQNSINYIPQMRTGKMRNKKSYVKSDTVYGSIRGDGVDVMSDQYYPVSIIEVSNASQKGKVHPTQKPVALMEYLIKTYTNPAETVLDFTMGSGTTGVACRNLDRNFIGIERDDKYFNIAVQRIYGVTL